MGENNTELKRKRVIAIMLDVQGTINNIDDATTIIFMNQLQNLRIKYNAERVIIHVSSHMHTAESLLPYLEILHRNLLPNIVLGNAFYLFGTYNYETGEEEYKGFTFNARKTEAFENCLDTNKYDRVCVGLIEDSLDLDCITRFQDKGSVFIIRPSQKVEENLQNDNLMCYSTQTEGFDGVLEGLDVYLNSIKDIPHESIVEKQRKVLKKHKDMGAETENKYL